MRSVSALDVRAKFGEILDEAAAGERFVIERAGRPIAAIVPLSDLDHVDPERIRDRRLAALDQLRQLGRRRPLQGPADAVASIRADRDHGHRA